MGTTYDKDVVAWANEQAALLRAGKFSAIDIEHIAEEIEDVGKSEQRELASRMAVLLAHLLKWQFQPEHRSNSWMRTIKEQRRAIAAHIEETPSLKVSLTRYHWLVGVWADAVATAVSETGLDDLPANNPWTMAQVLDANFFPNESITPST
ncbi:hypothetical protein FEMY_23410 [Ferrovum myxofaciens]|uniref:DUF29 domain-containing protein n=2 Tax=root TaxID=1 RepID=A0A149VV81_9PROT|nr:DUF29 domain-containing protein [Ferrovum myxofaciens]KXW57135.1 hypothetical protein FEMY_23410 [Ferrovum myxofaciens]